MRSQATELFQEFADAYARGDRPRARDYVSRTTGPDADLLAGMIDRFLASTPPRPATAEDERLFDALVSEPALLQARVRRGLRRDDVVAALIDELELDRSKSDKVREYYHRLESGLLDPERVDRRVYAALARLFKTAVHELARWHPEPPATATAYFRSVDAVVPAPPPAAPAAAEEPDEIDRLFTGR
jgi:hypothetical protein